MKAKGAPHDFMAQVVRVTKARERKRINVEVSASQSVRPMRFLMNALPLRSQKKSS